MGAAGYHTPEQVSNSEPLSSRPCVSTTTLLGGVNVVFCFGEMAPIAAKMVLDKGKLNKIVSEREVGTLQERQRDPKSSIFHP